MAIRVLIADDHRVVAQGIRVLLEAYPGIEVVGCVANGREALRGSVESCPDVVLMDHEMPELNGTDAARLIRDRCPATKVLMLSLHSDPAHVIRAFRAGAIGYVTKDCESENLIAAIHEVHAGRRYLSQGLADIVLRQLVDPGDSRDPLARLSSRERQVLQRLAEGCPMSDIATALSLSIKTVQTYRARIMDKLGIRHFAGLVKIAIQSGLVPLE
jgi:DNA-binding NarL/FixJ family response regulator